MGRGGGYIYLLDRASMGEGVFRRRAKNKDTTGVGGAKHPAANKSGDGTLTP